LLGANFLGQERNKEYEPNKNLSGILKDFMQDLLVRLL